MEIMAYLELNNSENAILKKGKTYWIQLKRKQNKTKQQKPIEHSKIAKAANTAKAANYTGNINTEIKWK